VLVCDSSMLWTAVGAIDVYYFENTQTGELRLYGTPGLIRAQSAQNDADLSSENPDSDGKTASAASNPLGVSEERRAPGGDPTLHEIER
jgi:hypothetical protein